MLESWEKNEIFIQTKQKKTSISYLNSHFYSKIKIKNKNKKKKE